jgi:uncharacterized protein YcfL
MNARRSAGSVRFAAAALVAGVASLGCKAFEPRGTAQNTYIGKEGGGELESLEGDPALADDLVMEGIRSERRDDRLFVQFNLKNTRNSNLAFEWTMEWFDASGFKISTAQHWTPVAIGGMGYETITQTAPTPEATSWRLGLRKPNSIR